jgi:hypothetical protein
MAGYGLMVAVVALGAPLAAQPNPQQPAAAKAPAGKAPAAKAPAAKAPAAKAPAEQKPAEQKQPTAKAAAAAGAEAAAPATDTAAAPAGGEKTAEAPAAAGASAAPAAADSAVPVYTPAAAPAPAPAPQSPPAAEPEPRRRTPAEFPAAAYLNIEQLWNTDPGYDLFDEDNVGGQLGVGLSYDLLPVAPDTVLVAELACSWESQEARGLYGGAIQETALKGQNLLVAASVHQRMLPWLGPHARLAVGLSRLEAELRGADFDERYRDKANFSLPFLRLGAGVSAEQVVGQRFALGLLIEGGYALGSAFEIELEPAGEQGQIQTEYASLGQLSRSGPYLRTALLARF